MENEIKEEKTIDPRFKFKPLKDSILFAISILAIVVIVLSSIFSKPKSDSVHVEIRYDGIVLWEKDDPTKNRGFSFPEEGERVITFKKEDGLFYIDKDFDFKSEEGISITLYSDKAIQIKSEDVTCPDHKCSRMGKISNTYTPIVCLPNHIQVMIIADGLPEFDA